MDEFALIDRYFFRRRRRRDVLLGIGDDAALCQVPPGMSLAVATDMLVEDVHFPHCTAAEAVGHKALAVNLSDLAAMGADPAWFTLALALPLADETWLEGFARGLFALADRYDCELVGGDTVRGPLAATVQALGWVPAGQDLRRKGALPGDHIYVTGTLGDAALGLAVVQDRLILNPEDAQFARTRLERPEPRLEVGRALRGIASAVIDVSDGLVADLGHILDASGVGARLWLERLPLSLTYQAARATVGWDPALAGGDDFELCFTVSKDHVARLDKAAKNWGCEFHHIGEIVADPGLYIEELDGSRYQPASFGHNHFPGRN